MGKVKFLGTGKIQKLIDNVAILTCVVNTDTVLYSYIRSVFACCFIT